MSSTGREAAERDPGSDRATLRAIQALTQRGAMREAVAHAEEALRGGLEHAFVLNLAALGAEGAGELERAAALLERARTLDPDNPGVRNALGLILQRLARYREALAQFDAALARDASFAPAHYNRGATLEALRALDAAAQAYSAALALDPAHAPSLAGLASLEERHGNPAEARRLATAALKLWPHYPLAAFVLAAAQTGLGAASVAEAGLREFLARPESSPFERARGLRLLGDALAAQARVEAAFVAYRQANEFLRTAYAGRASSGDAVAYLNGFASYFASAPSEWRRAPRGGESPRGLAGHAFVVGFPGTSTALLEHVLASHAQVEQLEGRETLADAVRTYLRKPGDLDRLLGAGDGELAEARRRYWSRVREEGADVEGRYFVDVNPLNTLKLPLIARLFPEAKIVFTVRDPRDVLMHALRRNLDASAAGCELLTLTGAAAYYGAAMRLAGAYVAGLALAVHSVRHESLVADFDGEAKSLCAFLGLPWPAPPGARSLDRDIAHARNAGGIGEWRAFAPYCQDELALLAPWVRQFGYDEA